MRWRRVKLSDAVEKCGPGKRWGHTCNAIRGGELLYVFGGYGRDNCQTNQVHVFDTVSLSWSQPIVKGIAPTPRDSHTCTTVGHNLFVFGGTDGLNPLKDLHILDTSSNTWITPSVRGEAPEAREGHTAALIGKRLFIFGGCGKSKNNVDEVYYNDLFVLNTETFIWQRAVPSGFPPSVRDSHTCSSWGSKMIVIGGEDGHDYYLSDVHVLDTDTLVWKELNVSGHVLPPRAGHSAVAIDNHLFVFGGFSDEQNLYDDLYMLDVDTGNWTKMLATGDGPSARFSMAVDCLDPTISGALAFIGGCNKSLEALDDMYFLYTDLAREFGREERRLEKLSMRKQLKMKCQIQHIPDPRESVANSQQGPQYFHLNEYQPTVGKRTFYAKVTQNLGNGYTIETVIDGKPLRGILISDKPLIDFIPSKNPHGEICAPKIEGKLIVDQEPKTKFSTPHDHQAEAATASVAKELGSSVPELPDKSEVVAATQVAEQDPRVAEQDPRVAEQDPRVAEQDPRVAEQDPKANPQDLNAEAFDSNQVSENSSVVPEGTSIPPSQGTFVPPSQGTSIPPSQDTSTNIQNLNL